MPPPLPTSGTGCHRSACAALTGIKEGASAPPYASVPALRVIFQRITAPGMVPGITRDPSGLPLLTEHGPTTARYELEAIERTGRLSDKPRGFRGRCRMCGKTTQC